MNSNLNKINSSIDFLLQELMLLPKAIPFMEVEVVAIKTFPPLAKELPTQAQLDLVYKLLRYSMRSWNFFLHF